MSVINKRVISPPSFGVPSFIDWLENRLDALGLDGCLYSRCILQVCHQPLAYIGQGMYSIYSFMSRSDYQKPKAILLF